jgi:hypothetical protein
MCHPSWRAPACQHRTRIHARPPPRANTLQFFMRHDHDMVFYHIRVCVCGLDMWVCVCDNWTLFRDKSDGKLLDFSPGGVRWNMKRARSLLMRGAKPCAGLLLMWKKCSLVSLCYREIRVCDYLGGDFHPPSSRRFSWHFFKADYSLVFRLDLSSALFWEIVLTLSGAYERKSCI